MAKFEAQEIDRILLLFRRYLTTNKLKLKLEDRKMMMKGIQLHKFTCAHAYYGVLSYENWALPILLNAHPTKSLDNVGEGLDRYSKEIFDIIRHQVFVRSLVHIMDGNLTDQMLMYAALIEAGHSAGVLPKLSERSSRIKIEADFIIKQRRQGELSDN